MGSGGVVHLHPIVKDPVFVPVISRDQG